MSEERAMYVQAVASWTGGAEASVPAAELLPARARGRASLLTRMIAEVVALCAQRAAYDLAQTPLIVGSAYGEMETTMQLLAMMGEGDGQLSPARFQASVHNAAAGQLSIATGSRGFSTCLGAGHATPSAVLIEAYALLACDERDVIVVLAEEALPPFFAQGGVFAPAAVGLALSREPRPGALAVLEAPRSTGRASSTMPAHALAPSPVAPFALLAEAVLARRWQAYPLPGVHHELEVVLRALEGVP